MPLTEKPRGRPASHPGMDPILQSSHRLIGELHLRPLALLVAP